MNTLHFLNYAQKELCRDRRFQKPYPKSANALPLKGGGHPAQLNYGDCFAAAAATIYKMPLLYAGKDFQAAGS